MKSNQHLPDIIKNVGFEFRWSEEKVWALSVPVEAMDIRELTWHFAVPFWRKPGGYYDLSPDEVIANPKQYQEEYERTMRADLQYPLDILFWKGRWVLLDGLHRLLKAYLLKQKTVNVRKIPGSAIALIQVS